MTQSVYGIIVYNSVLVIISLKAAIELTSWTWMTHLFIWTGLISWFSFIAIFCRKAIAIFISPILIDADIIVFNTPLFYATLGIPIIALIPDFIYVAIRNTIFKPAHIIIAELERSRDVDWEERNYLNVASEKLSTIQNKKTKFAQKYRNYF